LAGGIPIANYDTELANELSNLPSAAISRGKEMGGEDSVLAGADVCSGLARSFPLLVAAEGFLTGRFQMFSPGVFGSGSCLAFLARKNRTRTWPGMVRRKL
jgi:hypothetical protein